MIFGFVMSAGANADGRREELPPPAQPIMMFAALGWSLDYRETIRAEPKRDYVSCRQWLPALMRLVHADPARFHALALKGLAAKRGSMDEVMALHAAFAFPTIQHLLEGALRHYRDTTTEYRFDPGPSPAPEPPSGRERGATPAARPAQPAKRVSKNGPARFRWPRPR